MTPPSNVRSPIRRPQTVRPTPRVQSRAAVLPSERIVCPRCGRPDARIIGRSESVAVVYLRCDVCHLASVTAG
jgi:hypothetical protein